jgi:hypothetical protein
MSRAEVDLLLVAIDETDESVECFRSDPEGFVSEWERTYHERSDGRWTGGTLNEQERLAVVSSDHGALYRMGAHPFLLWQMVRSVAGDSVPLVDLVESYRRAVEPWGYPFFGT